jgi:predicted molibdopterin-dependent oxidoreductase YjgC
MARAFPDRAAAIRFESAQAIRDEIARAVPLYKGIDTLRAKGDQLQWGGRTLYADGKFATPDGKAHFAIVSTTVRLKPDTTSAPYVASGFSRTFRVSTRRGKQFNSMIQRDVDPLTGAGRDDILISADDLQALGLDDGAPVELRSGCGTFTGRLKAAPIRPGNLEVHWPEGNTLLSPDAIDPDSMEPDYNADVTLIA